MQSDVYVADFFTPLHPLHNIRSLPRSLPENVTTTAVSPQGLAIRGMTSLAPLFPRVLLMDMTLTCLLPIAERKREREVDEYGSITVSVAS